MRGNVIETVIGAIVLVVAGLFLFYAYSRSDVGAVGGYGISARFSRVDGLTPGSDVRISGIKVGTVVDQELDPETYMAVVGMTIDSNVRLPDDSSAKITSEGLLGNYYVAIEPGASETMLDSGDQIVYTQGAVDLMSLIGQAVFRAGGAGEAPGGQSPAQSPAPFP